ncbi:MAG: hypothetical protein ACR2MB_09060 [Acidimicrobiales bacterium]
MTRSLHRRLDAIAKALPTDRIEQLERLASQVAIEHRIDAWSAGREDFEILMAATLDDARRELIDAAVGHRVHRWRFGPPLVDEWRPHLLAAAAVDHAPTEPERRAAIATLEELAKPRDEPVPGRVDPWDSYWFEANRYLVVLGDDKGASLHEAAAETMASAREVWLKERDRLSSRIGDGDARRVEFLIWVQPDLEARRLQLLDHAVERRRRRQGGDPLGIDDVYDAAVEVASYLPGEPEPETAAWLLFAAREQHPVVGTPCHEEWALANEAYWVLGSDGGKKIRARLELMVMRNDPNTDEEEATIMGE